MKRLDIGATLSGVFDLYGKQAGVLLPAALLLFIPVTIVAVLLTALIVGGTAATTMSPADFNAAGEYTGGGEGVLGLLGGALLAGLLTAALFYAATVFYQGLVADSVEDMRDGRRDLGVGDLFRNAGAVAGKLIGLGVVFLLVLIAVLLVTGLLTALFPLLGLIGVVLGLMLVVWWAVAAPAVAIEKIGPLQALGRSRQLTQGFFWQVLLIIVVIIILTWIVSVVIGLIFALLGDIGGVLGSIISSTLTAPLAGLAAALMYFQLRGDVGPADASGTPAAATPPPPVPPVPPAPPTSTPPSGPPPGGPAV